MVLIQASFHSDLCIEEKHEDIENMVPL